MVINLVTRSSLLSFMLSPSLFCFLPQENVLVDDQGHAQLADFGLASIKDTYSTGYTSSIIGGSLRFMAPELLEHDMPVRTTNSDVYALVLTCAQVSELDTSGEKRFFQV
jgi:serine/threonine protein kinase